MRRLGVLLAALASLLAAPAVANGGVVAFSSTACESFGDYEARKPPPFPSPLFNPFPPPDDGSVCPQAIWAVADSGAGLHRISGGPTDNPYFRGDFEPSWSPDGSHIVYQRQDRDGAHLRVIRVDGTADRRVDPRLPDGQRLSLLGAVWTPGGRIVGAGGPLDAQGFPAPASDVYSMRPDGSDVTRLTTTGDHEGGVAVAPDGRILFRRGASPPGPPTFGRPAADPGVFILDPGTREEVRAVAGGFDDAFDAEFSRDGGQIAFFHPDAHTYTMEADGSRLERRTGIHERNPTWGSDSTLIFSGRASTGPLYEDGRSFITSLDLSRDKAVRRVLTPSIDSGDYPAWHPGLGLKRPELLRDVLPPAVQLFDDDTKERVGAVRRSSRASVSASRSVRRAKLRYVSADRSGIRSVSVAVFRGRGLRCVFLARKGFARSRCSRPVLLRVGGRPSWERLVQRLRPGTWGFRFRARDGQGNTGGRPRAVFVRLR